MPDPTTKQRADTGANMIAVLLAGMFVLALLFAAWRLGRKISELSVRRTYPNKGQ
jgi:hypothetical protein